MILGFLMTSFILAWVIVVSLLLAIDARSTRFAVTIRRLPSEHIERAPTNRDLCQDYAFYILLYRFILPMRLL